MNCPGCGADNLEGSKFCRSCGGAFAPYGVDYSRQGTSQDGDSSYSSDSYNERRRDRRNSLFVDIHYVSTGVASLVGLAFLGIYSLGRALDERSGLLFLAAIASLAMAVLIFYRLTVQARENGIHADDGMDVLTTEEATEACQNLSRLPPRR